jgi:hypothetical protein
MRINKIAHAIFRLSLTALFTSIALAQSSSVCRRFVAAKLLIRNDVTGVTGLLLICNGLSR